MFKRLQGHIDALTLEIGEKEPTIEQAIASVRYRRLIAQTAEELNQFQALTIAETEALADLGIGLGGTHARQMLAITIGDSSIAGRFNALPKETIQTLLGFLSPDGPLYERLKLLAPATTQGVADAISEGVGLGHNPRKIADAVQNEFGKGLTSALRTVRTVQLWSYREANRATYIANSDILEGWIWHAAIGDPRTCMSCIVQHGTLHPLDENLNDHYNGRCAMIPKVKGIDSPVTESGIEMFEKLPEAQQRALMGVGKYEAWRAGRFQLPALSGEQRDDVYGKMRIEQSLKALIPA